MSQSKSSPTNTTSNASTVTTSNKNVSGNTGTTIQADNGSNVGLTVVNNDTSAATVQAGLSAGLTAFGVAAKAVTDAVDSTQSTSQDAIDSATGLSKQALAIASAQAKASNQQNIDSLNTVNSIATNFATQLTGVVSSEQAALQQDQASSQTQLANVTNALTTSFIQGSTSANQTVVNALQSASDNETKVFKYVAIAIAAVAGVILLKNSKVFA